VLLVSLAAAAVIGNALEPEKRPFVYVIEDDAGDEYMTLRALKGLAKTTEVQKDGQMATARLFELCDQSKVPDVILLDLKLPLLNGFEILSILKEDERTRSIPVVVFTSSDLEQDQESAISLGASNFVSKPVDYHKYMDSVKKAVHGALLRLS
jgi:two-component system response regulator